MDDARIIDLFWRRDERAVEAVSGKYGRYCHAIARRILHSDADADESVNDTWLAAWKSIPPHRPAMLSTYLGKLTRNISLKKWHARHAEKRGGGEVALALDELAECVPAGDSVDAAMERQALAKALDAFLLNLPQNERRVFICRYWYLEPVSEIAARFGYSQSKVKSMLFRTRNRLRDWLRREGIYEEE